MPPIFQGHFSVEGFEIKAPSYTASNMVIIWDGSRANMYYSWTYPEQAPLSYPGGFFGLLHSRSGFEAFLIRTANGYFIAYPTQNVADLEHMHHYFLER